MHKSDSILIVPDVEQEKYWFLNVTNLCKVFGKIERCITVIFFDACRDSIEDYPFMYENNKEDNDGEGWFTLKTKK